ncbi:ubiquitin C-terminal hydrolase 12-like [Macadamia integrifolia]|uniref:ubiquitin C-terminal hydrolase 12-like n=1 Tax=Macadamia integrifolia TaxID=60698 RepID=UPI001C4F1D5F|nr:ubiquitin C-terminal hydrolase 12-like [Macadamia integrifolia]
MNLQLTSLRIKSFSLLSKSSLERYDSGDFEAGGYKWKLRRFPKGNKNKNGEGQISHYLVMSETDSLPPGWAADALFRLLVLDQIRDNFHIWLDANGRARRFGETKIQSECDRFITLKEFNDPTKGYLVDDTCVFGAEVFVHRCSVVGKGEYLLMTTGPSNCNLRKQSMSYLVKDLRIIEAHFLLIGTIEKQDPESE